MVRELVLMLAGATALLAQGEKIRVIAFGAHPDDCDIRASGTAALFAAAGHAVKFVSVTNGDVGHQTMQRAALAERRLGEARESARRLGIEYEVLNNHDGELLPTLEVRKQIIRRDPPVACGHCAGAQAQRLSSRSPLYGRSGAGCGLYGGGAAHGARGAGAAQEPGVSLL